MKHDGFRYDFTGKELKYFLFGKKVCPKCHGKLEQNKGFETVEGAVFNSKSEAFFIPNSQIKHYLYIYCCEKCGAEFKLSELAK